jgi:uncharacterized RDD family membrane protein YckC
VTYNSNEQGVAQDNQIQIKPAGAWQRYWATVIDGLFLLLPILLILALIYFIHPSLLSDFTSKKESGTTYGIISIGLIILSLLYSVYLTVNKGATWGKDAYGLKVVKYKTTENISYSKSVLRELLKAGLYFIPVISGLFVFINSLTIVFSSEKRGIHDKIAGTQVIKFKKPWSMKKQIFILLLPLLIIVFLPPLLYFMTTVSIRPQSTGSNIPSFGSVREQFPQANNTKRSSDINAILNGVNQYAADNHGKIPDVITTSEREISKSQADLCSVFVPSYLAALPTDPKVNDGTAITNCSVTYTTGYTIFKDSANKITVGAPNAELGEKITVTK